MSDYSGYSENSDRYYTDNSDYSDRCNESLDNINSGIDPVNINIPIPTSNITDNPSISEKSSKSTSSIKSNKSNKSNKSVTWKPVIDNSNPTNIIPANPNFQPQPNSQSTLSNSSVLVLILNQFTKESDSNIQNLSILFSDPYFITKILVIDAPPEIPSNIPPEEYTDNFIMRKALTYASSGGTNHPWKDLPCILVRDTSVSDLSPDAMKIQISTALSAAPNADLYYLCRWNDNCTIYKPVEGVSSIDHGGTIMWSVGAHSTQAIMYTPFSRDFISDALVDAKVPLDELLNNYISSMQLRCIVYVPNIISYDITKATYVEDYSKDNGCAPTVIVSGSTGSWNNVVWFWTIVAVVGIVSWFLISAGYKWEKDHADKREKFFVRDPGDFGIVDKNQGVVVNKPGQGVALGPSFGLGDHTVVDGGLKRDASGNLPPQPAVAPIANVDLDQYVARRDYDHDGN